MAGLRKNCVIVPLLIYLVHGKVDATVTLALDSELLGEGNVLCNSKAVVTCSIQHYEIMTWTVDKSFVFECEYNSCKTHKNGGGSYVFSFDTSSGTFNISLDPVTLAQNGKVIKCDDGFTSSSLVLNVHVIPDNSHTQITTLKRGILTDIRVTTGCIFPGTNTQFEWFIFEDGYTAEPYTSTRSIQSTTENGCSRSQCGGKGVMKVTNTLTIKEDPDGRKFNFQVLVKLPFTTDIIMRAGRPLKLNGEGLNLTSLLAATSNGRTATLNFATLLYALEIIFSVMNLKSIGNVN